MYFIHDLFIATTKYDIKKQNGKEVTKREQFVHKWSSAISEKND